MNISNIVAMKRLKLDQIELELGPRVSGRGCVAKGGEKDRTEESLRTDGGRMGIRGSLRGPRGPENIEVGESKSDTG